MTSAEPRRAGKGGVNILLLFFSQFHNLVINSFVYYFALFNFIQGKKDNSKLCDNWLFYSNKENGRNGELIETL